MKRAQTILPRNSSTRTALFSRKSAMAGSILFVLLPINTPRKALNRLRAIFQPTLVDIPTERFLAATLTAQRERKSNSSLHSELPPTISTASCCADAECNNNKTQLHLRTGARLRARRERDVDHQRHPSAS
jgi:hypothetical protein